MARAALLVVAAALAAGSARAQGAGPDFSGSLWSGFPTGLQSGFQGSISSGFQSGFGQKSPPAQEVLPEDVTLALGGTGQLRPSMLLAQPSNFLPSLMVTAPIGGPVPVDNGPSGPLTFDNGPAGPMD
jgi:opacity protein-like surface antigen